MIQKQRVLLLTIGAFCVVASGALLLVAALAVRPDASGVTPIGSPAVNSAAPGMPAAPSENSIAVNTDWPPKEGKPYPDLELTDASGKQFRVSDFRGKVILVEFSAMSCPGSQSLAGAHQFGPFGRMTPQPGIKPLSLYVAEMSDGALLGDDDFVLIRVVVFDDHMNSTSPQQLKEWTEHFHLNDDSNVVVATGPSWIAGKDPIGSIPGFHLVDRNFVLRSNISTPSRQPLFYSTTLPMIPGLLLERAP